MTRIDPKAMAFRKERAADLELLAKSTNKYGVIISHDPSFKEAIRKLRDENHIFLDENEKQDIALWGYTIDRLIVQVPIIPRHTVPAVQQLSLRIGMKFTANWQDWQQTRDPSRQLNLNVLLLGVNKDESNCLSSYHLDKHLEALPILDAKAKTAFPQKANLKSPSEVHPLYHMQFSGSKISKEKEAIDLNLVGSGNLFMDAPRFMHHPLDFVLGVDFLLSNYFPETWNKLQRDGFYTTLCRKYQTAFWKPYIHALAQHWDLQRDKNCWNAKKAIWPNLF